MRGGDIQASNHDNPQKAPIGFTESIASGLHAANHDQYMRRHESNYILFGMPTRTTLLANSFARDLAGGSIVGRQPVSIKPVECVNVFHTIPARYAFKCVMLSRAVQYIHCLYPLLFHLESCTQKYVHMVNRATLKP